MNPSCDFISRDPYDPNSLKEIRSAAALYLADVSKPVATRLGPYKRAGDYIRYKKAQAIAAGVSGPRPSQTNSIVTALQATCTT